MKKLILSLVTLLLITTLSINLKADSNSHIICKNADITANEIAKLEDKLTRIEKEYDISIYYIYDPSISDIKEYSIQFLQSHSNSSSNIVMVARTSNNAYIYANGRNSQNVLDNAENITSIYNDNIDYLYDAITYFYKYSIKYLDLDIYNLERGKIITSSSYVQDLANILSNGEVNSLHNQLLSFKNATNIDFAIVTVDELLLMVEQDYADDYFDYNYNSENGILFLYNSDEKLYYCSTKGVAQTRFNDNKIDIAVDAMRSSIRDGKYYQAFNLLINKASDLLVVVTPPNTLQMKNFIIAIVVAAIITLIVALILVNQVKNVKAKYSAVDYIVPNSFMLTGAIDQYIDTKVTKTKRESSSGGSSSGSSHHSSSGSSHSGHGGRF